MYNYLLTLEYEGTRYKGFSSPKSSNTVSDHLLTALYRVSGMEEVKLIPAVKTENGVHAIHQTVNFKSEKKWKVKELKKEMNQILPLDIAVTDIRQVQERFDASLNLKQCTYMYKIDTSPYSSVFKRNTALHIPEELDIKNMDKVAKELAGQHDFKNFCNVKKVKNTVHTITEISLLKDDKKQELLLTISADRFLKGMPLMIVDLLIKAGRNQVKSEDIPKLFQGEATGLASAFPGGLYLLDTTYL